MTIEYNLSRKDFEVFYKYYFWSSEDMKGFRKIQYFILFLLLSASFYFFSILKFPLISEKGITFLLVSLFFVAAYVLLNFPGISNLVSRNWVSIILKDLQYLGLIGKNKIVFGDSSIELFFDSTATKRINYSSLKSFKESDSHYYLFLKDASAIIIPKDSLAENISFKTMVQRKMQGEVFLKNICLN
jgi:hypothetical protein